MARQLELLDNLGAFVDGQHDARRRDAEARARVAEGLHAAKSGVGRDERPVKGPEAVHVFGRVFQHSVSRP